MKILKYWSLVVLWAGLIFYLSSRPGLNSGLAVFWDVFLRKLAHASIFGILFFLIFNAFYFGHKINFWRSLFWSLAFSVLYAFFDEAHQYFVRERQARLLDVGIDSLGISILSCLTVLFWKIKNRRQELTNGKNLFLL